jgi:hypothetical protein
MDRKATLNWRRVRNFPFPSQYQRTWKDSAVLHLTAVYQSSALILLSRPILDLIALRKKKRRSVTRWMWLLEVRVGGRVNPGVGDVVVAGGEMRES